MHHALSHYAVQSMNMSWQQLFALPRHQRGLHRFHLIGIAGTGVGPIARVLLEMGFQVSGSDRQSTSAVQKLRELGAQVYEGHAAEHVASQRPPRLPAAVLASSAVPPHNPEILFAREQGIPVVNRNAFLGPLTGQRQVLAVAGTHGKTTTTGMLAHALQANGQDCGYIIGSEVAGLGAGHAGQSPLFVIEADEYDYAFLGLHPQTIALTSMDWDHPDCFPTPAAYEDAFRQFISQLKSGDGRIIACSDDAAIRRLLATVAGELEMDLYGTREPATWRIGNIDINPQQNSYVLQPPHGPALSVNLQVPGLHNIYNSAAAIIAASQHGVALHAAAEALASFRGAQRRFEIKGEVNDIIVVDDYAHHPREIRTTLSAARARYPDRSIWAVYQPHTYSRTKALLDQFDTAFSTADHLLVTDIYAARETFDPDINAAQVVAASRHPQAMASGDLEQTLQHLLHHVQPHSLIVILSAGSASQLGPRLLQQLNSDLNPSAT